MAGATALVANGAADGQQLVYTFTPATIDPDTNALVYDRRATAVAAASFDRDDISIGHRGRKRARARGTRPGYGRAARVQSVQIRRFECLAIQGQVTGVIDGI